jgi:hypothetical protein
MSARLAPALTVAVLLVAACGGAAPEASRPPAAQPVATQATATPDRPDPTPVIGDVVAGHGGPELTVEPLGGDAMEVTIRDRAAKAWRLTVAGVGEKAADRWEILVETGDTGPVITATEVVDGSVVDTMDLSAFADGTAAAGGCHSTLPACLDSDGFSLPSDGDGRFSVRLHLPDVHTPLVVGGASAAWTGEPFVLGPWRETDPFPWGEG